ncbi:MAG: sugar phosphate isomerase/epimerase [Lachnospiraceae bacterium]|nr:sugar phosphate isomerase/epimerase [Lachnospiraceae bacterium]
MKVGTCIRGNHIFEDLENAIKLGFDTVELYFNETLGGLDLDELSKKMKSTIGDSGVTISGIGLYCNPLTSEQARAELRYCMENAHLFGTDFIGTFAGAVSGKSVDDSMPEFKKVFSELVRVAESSNVRIGIENAHMYGHWYGTTCNIGFCPRAWEMMFQEVDSDRLGLEWEPAHQVGQLINPIQQLNDWLPKVFHVHGKDAQLNKKHIEKYGIWFGESYCKHCFPGRGDTDWKEIIHILQRGGYQGDIAVEGYHDSVYCGERELEGQKLALEYLRKCILSETAEQRRNLL